VVRKNAGRLLEQFQLQPRVIGVDIQVTALELVEAHLEYVEHALQCTGHERVGVLVLDRCDVGAEVVDPVREPRHRLDLGEQGARPSDPRDVRLESQDDLYEQRDGLDAQPDDDAEHDVVVTADE
jgi:hypothetical protein